MSLEGPHVSAFGRAPRVRAPEDARQVGTSPFEVIYPLGIENGTALANSTAANNFLWAYLFRSGRGGSIDRLGADVAAAVATSVFRVGIYDVPDVQTLYPGALLVESGERSAASAGMNLANVVQSLDKDRLYAAAVLTGTAAPNLRQIPPDALYPYFGVGASGGSLRTLLRVSQAYGAMPDPFTPGGTSVIASAAFAVFVRYAA